MRRLEGLSILIVEDEPMVSIFLEDALEAMGCIVAGVAAREDEAVAIIEAGKLNAAVLDVNLGGGTSRNLAHMLQQKNIPFIFATGYGAAGVSEEFPAVPVLTKPFTEEDLGQALNRLLNPLTAGPR